MSFQPQDAPPPEKCPATLENINSGDADVARLANLCKELGLGEEATREAFTLLKDSNVISLASPFWGKSVEEAERYCFAFVIYCVVKMTKDEKTDRRVKLQEILKISNLKALEFLQEVELLSLKASGMLAGRYGPDWEERVELKQFRNNVKLLADASKFYNKKFGELFSSTAIEQEIPTRSVSEFRQFGWLLFLTLRINAPELFKDLVSCIHGIAAIIAILVLHMPVKLRKFSFQDSPLFVRTEKGVDILISLSQTCQTLEDRLKTMMEKAQDLIANVLNITASPASDSKEEQLENIDTDGLTYFQGLLDEQLLQSNLLSLEKYCDASNNNMCDLDERLFGSNMDDLLGEECSSRGVSSLCDIVGKFERITTPKRTVGNMFSVARSPMRENGSSIDISSMIQMTPVSSAMTTAKWLREVLSPLSGKPSLELRSFLSACDKDVTNDVICRANILLDAIFLSSTSRDGGITGSLHCSNAFDATWARERKMEASKFYFRILGAICGAESQLLNRKNLTTLLSNECFHRCLIACSAELVLAAHKTVIMMFPAVLIAAGLTAFDFSKVIESFVRHEETLPRELKRHLNSLEEKLLESLAWEKSSSLYNSLVVARPALAAQITSQVLLAEPMPSLDDIAARANICCAEENLPLPSREHEAASIDQNENTRSPKRICTENRYISVENSGFTTPPAKERVVPIPNSLRPKLPNLQFAFASPSHPIPIEGSKTCAEVGVKVFFSKVLKLAAIRIRSLCERLQQSEETSERVYSIFQQILEQHTALFFNRHIDQLILCSLYGVAKVSQLSLTFREIVSNYKREPQCKPEVFRSVFVGSSSSSSNGVAGVRHVDIINFYNEVFIPTVKPLLVSLFSCGVQPENGNHTKAGETPKLQNSPFKNLPIMSPKKVSASHNVYVSPLRQSKKDALLSPSSRSYYACLGESTHAYQSPSKDLAAINNRLNSSGRRVNSRLNFDVVSDSVVANSLGYPNGSSASSDAAAAFGLPVKTEHLEP